MDNSTAKLTKKQKKSLAFRQRKGKHVEEPRDVPEVDVVDEENEPVPPADRTLPTPTSGTKRKRGDGDHSVLPAKKSKKTAITTESAAGDTEPPEVTKEKTKNHRYILFVGARHWSYCL